MTVILLTLCTALSSSWIALVKSQECGEKVKLYPSGYFNAFVNASCTYYYENLETDTSYSSIKNATANGMLLFRYDTRCNLCKQCLADHTRQAKICLPNKFPDLRRLTGEFIWTGHDDRFRYHYRDSARVFSYQMDTHRGYSEAERLSGDIKQGLYMYNCGTSDEDSRFYRLQYKHNDASYLPGNCRESLYQPLLLKYDQFAVRQLDTQKLKLELEITNGGSASIEERV